MAHDAEIELDAARRPGPAQGDLAEFQDMVGIEKFAAAGFFGRAPDLAARLGEDRDGDVRILEADDRPFLVDARAAELVKEKIGIEAGSLPGRAGEDRDRVRIGERVGFDRFLRFADGRAALCAAAGRDRTRTGREPCDCERYRDSQDDAFVSHGAPPLLMVLSILLILIGGHKTGPLKSLFLCCWITRSPSHVFLTNS